MLVVGAAPPVAVGLGAGQAGREPTSQAGRGGGESSPPACSSSAGGSSSRADEAPAGEEGGGEEGGGEEGGGEEGGEERVLLFTQWLSHVAHLADVLALAGVHTRHQLTRLYCVVHGCTACTLAPNANPRLKAPMHRPST